VLANFSPGLERSDNPGLFKVLDTLFGSGQYHLGSGWVGALLRRLIVNGPTRYREVVLTRTADRALYLEILFA
jgi:hypothetical protein